MAYRRARHWRSGLHRSGASQDHDGAEAAEPTSGHTEEGNGLKCPIPIDTEATVDTLVEGTVITMDAQRRGTAPTGLWRVFAAAGIVDLGKAEYSRQRRTTREPDARRCRGGLSSLGSSDCQTTSLRRSCANYALEDFPNIYRI